jgi:hypothetical protein
MSVLCVCDRSRYMYVCAVLYSYVVYKFIALRRSNVHMLLASMCLHVYYNLHVFYDVAVPCCFQVYEWISCVEKRKAARSTETQTVALCMRVLCPEHDVPQLLTCFKRWCVSSFSSPCRELSVCMCLHVPQELRVCCLHVSRDPFNFLCWELHVSACVSKAEDVLSAFFKRCACIFIQFPVSSLPVLSVCHLHVPRELRVFSVHVFQKWVCIFIQFPV